MNIVLVIIIIIIIIDRLCLSDAKTCSFADQSALLSPLATLQVEYYSMLSTSVILHSSFSPKQHYKLYFLRQFET